MLEKTKMFSPYVAKMETMVNLFLVFIDTLSQTVFVDNHNVFSVIN